MAQSTAPSENPLPPNPHRIQQTAGASQGVPNQAQVQLTPEQQANFTKMVALAATILNIPVSVLRCPDDDADAFFDCFYREEKENGRPVSPPVQVQTTVAQLLAEIADNTKATVYQFDAPDDAPPNDDDEPPEDEEERPPPRRGQSRRRGA